MKTLETLKQEKFADQEFFRLYQRECHVCITTMRIFEALEQQNRSIESIAAAFNLPAEKILSLKDADYCDPEMVLQLCRHLSLVPPADCPRMKK